MVEVPEDPPATCPACDRAYGSVTVHTEGLMVNLLDNERYRRVCVEPTASGGTPAVEFYHHTHEQAGTDGTEQVAEDAGRDGRPAHD